MTELATRWQIAAALDVFAPREAVRTIDWARDFATDEGGHPYDHFAYPHLGAPGGPLHAIDCRQYLEIWLQWGTRLGKSFCGQVGAMKTADVEPCPMIYVGPSEDLAYQVVDRTVRMIEHCDRLKDQLPQRRDSSLIELALCRMFVGWPRSPATLADKDIGFGHGGEIDKWVQQKTSGEADPLELLFERFKNRVAYKIILEGSPGLRGASRIEAGRLSGTNAHYWVPCQRCGRRQPLVPSQIKHEHGDNARYVCMHCGGENRDEDRGPMMRAGVWVPEGCTVDDKKADRAVELNNQSGRPLWGGFTEDADWLIGAPVRDGESYSSQLSSLYALSLTWGKLAKAMQRAEESPEKKRNWLNSWLAETYQRGRRTESWETLGTKLMVHDCGRGELPPGYRLLFAGIDKQESKYVVVIEAWAPGRTSHTVDYVECDTEEDLLALLDEEYLTADGQKVKVLLSLLDSGFRPKDVYGLVDRAKQRGIHIVPCRGATRPLGPGVMYEKRRLSKKTARPGAPYVLVDTLNTQDWIDRQLHDTKPGAKGGTSLFKAELGEHQDFLEQLLNEAAEEDQWKVVDENVPVDYRDAKRYAAVAMLVKTRGKEIREPKLEVRDQKSEISGGQETPQDAQKQPARKVRDRTTPLRRPGGWLNMP